MRRFTAIIKDKILKDIIVRFDAENKEEASKEMLKMAEFIIGSRESSQCIVLEEDEQTEKFKPASLIVLNLKHCACGNDWFMVGSVHNESCSGGNGFDFNVLKCTNCGELYIYENAPRVITAIDYPLHNYTSL